MKKFVCTVCGYIHEGADAPDSCPICKAAKSAFKEQADELVWACEHVVGGAKGVDQRIIDGLNANFLGECQEVGMYLAMARQAEREGYSGAALTYRQIAWEEAEHAAKFAEMLGDVLDADTLKNLEVRVIAENGACKGKLELAKLAKELGLDLVHDTVHEMAKDEARHGKNFQGVLKRYTDR